MASLEETLKAFIARDFCISPQEVTPEFIRKWRRGRSFNKSRLEFRSHYGGYRGARLRNLSEEQINSNRNRTLTFFGQISHDIAPETTTK
jgi:hypothetical protein